MEELYNPYAGRDKKGNWKEGYTSKEFVDKLINKYETLKKIKENIDSEGLIKFFEYLAKKGEIPK